MHRPSLDDLDCLILWPDNTVGYQQEQQLVSTLLRLCEEHGFGRVPQLAEWIAEVWRDPQKIEQFTEAKRAHLQFMEEGRRLLEQDGQ